MISLKQTNKGFTIIELLIVIVVIGILAAIVLTSYGGVTAKANNAKRTTDISALANQLEVYYTTNSYYPSLTQLNTGTAAGTAALSTWITTNIKGFDQAGTVDPSNVNKSHNISATAGAGLTAKQYSYVVTQADGTTSCEADSTTCAKFVLSAPAVEAGAAALTRSSLN